MLRRFEIKMQNVLNYKLIIRNNLTNFKSNEQRAQVLILCLNTKIHLLIHLHLFKLFLRILGGGKFSIY